MCLISLKYGMPSSKVKLVTAKTGLQEGRQKNQEKESLKK